MKMDVFTNNYMASDKDVSLKNERKNVYIYIYL